VTGLSSVDFLSWYEQRQIHDAMVSDAWRSAGDRPFLVGDGWDTYRICSDMAVVVDPAAFGIESTAKKDHRGGNTAMSDGRAGPSTCVMRYDVPALPANYSFA